MLLAFFLKKIYLYAVVGTPAISWNIINQWECTGHFHPQSLLYTVHAVLSSDLTCNLYIIIVYNFIFQSLTIHFLVFLVLFFFTFYSAVEAEIANEILYS